MTGLIGLKTCYSLLWGTDGPEVMLRRAAGLGWRTVAVTDHESLYALPAIARHLHDLPCRVVFGATLRFPSAGDKVVVLLEDAAGYANLCRIITRWHAARQGIDLVGSPIGQVPRRRELCPEGPAQVIGDRVEGLLFIVESRASARHLQEHGAAVWHRVGSNLKRPPTWVDDLGLDSVFVPEPCMAEASRYPVHRLLRAIAGGTSVEAVPESACASESAHLHSPGHYRRRFGVFARALERVDAVLERARFRPKARTIFPPSPHRGRAIEVLRRKAYDGAVHRYGEPSDSVISRMEYELELIESKGFAEYFLVVEDIVATSPRTCGRGSGAASLVNYCLGVTNVDPIRYNLMFERFLNPGRTDPPDIDIDFAWDERDGVLDEAFARHGRTRAAMVCNHLRFQPRMALRETARTMGLTEDEINRALERMPEMRRELGPMSVTDRTRLGESRDTGSVVVKLPAPWGRVVPMAAGLVGLPRMLSMHCGGMVIVPDELASHVPVETSAKGYPMIQWEKDGSEEMGLVKIDLLGNRSLAVIRDAVRGIARDEGRPVETVLPEVPAGDPDTCRLVARGDTMGVFYVESPSMRLLQKKADRGDFEHLVIHSSIIRPAANHYINEYLDRLHGKPWAPLHPRLAGVFDETYGVPVYQEDVSKLAMALAGFDATEADRLRKCLGKRDAARRLDGHKDEFYR
ncbi:MAG: PHP domain-containing protein, partial [Planctomycetota bacterium]